MEHDSQKLTWNEGELKITVGLTSPKSPRCKRQGEIFCIKTNCAVNQILVSKSRFFGQLRKCEYVLL